jgi:hypothetical protein
MLSQSILLMAVGAPASSHGLRFPFFAGLGFVRNFLKSPLKGKTHPHLSGHQPENRLRAGVTHN